ncbi:hypothetical protein [Salinibacillus xinjiangensis]|nr:hypothetical protein [Salinibacillus xinjiangensis]
MALDSKNTLSMESTTLTNLLSLVLILLTIFHHFTVKKKINELKE